MRRNEILQRIEEGGLIAVIRLDDPDKLGGVVESLSNGGVKALEITMTTPGALEAMAKISTEIDEEFLIGAGTVLDPETARMSLLAGAKFVVGPTLNLAVIRLVHRYDRVVIPGGFTPTEILSAWDHGADVVKVFPAAALGPRYFQHIHGPLPQVKLSPTGGISLENAGEFIRAGACCLGVGSALVARSFVAESDWQAIAQRAKAFIREIQKAREELSG